LNVFVARTIYTSGASFLKKREVGELPVAGTEFDWQDALVYGIRLCILDDIDVLSDNKRSIGLRHDVEQGDQQESRADRPGGP
jgi:hypothetical protein